MTIKLSEPQADFVFSPHTHPGFFGGFGAGKSQAGTLRLIHLITQDPGIDVSHFFPSYRLAKRRGLTGTQAHLKALGIEYTLNKSDLTVYLPRFGSTIYLETYHDPDAIVSFEVAHAVVDELDTLNRDEAEVVWRKVAERTRQNCNHPAGNTLSCVTTPDQGTSGFCFQTWGNGEYLEDGYHYIKAGTRSNKFLPAGYADGIAKNYDPVMAEAYLDGGWVSFTQNKVYHFFSRERHHTDRRILPTDTVIHIGLDFNIGGCCAVVYLIENNNPVAVDEFTSYDTRDFVNNLTRYKGKTVMVYPDASGGAGRTNASESDISIIEKAGYQVNAHPSNPAIRDRVNAYNGLLAHDRLTINTDMCPNTTNALETQGYDAKGEPEKWNTHPAVDDWCFSGDTHITVNDEQILFKDVPVSGVIRGADGENIRFTNGGVKGYDELFTVVLDNGMIVKCTKEHQFLTLNGWIEARHLTGETVCHTELYQLVVKNLKGKSTILERMGTSIKRSAAFNACLKERREKVSTAKSGNTITDRYLTDVLSITKMKTRQIIHSIIFRCCPTPAIEGCIIRNGTSSTQITPGASLRRIRLNVLSGIGRVLGVLGTSRITKTISIYCTEHTREYASNVAVHTQARIEGTIDSAQSDAKRQREDVAGLIMKRGAAAFAQQHSVRTSTPPRNTVVKSVTSSGEREAVYCLTTETGYFALGNGLITSNCDSSGYFLAYKFPVRGNNAGALYVSGGLKG